MRVNSIPGICILLLIFLSVSGVTGDGDGTSYVKPEGIVPIIEGNFTSNAIESENTVTSVTGSQTRSGTEHGYMQMDDTMAISFAEAFNQDTVSAVNVAASSDFKSASLPKSVDLSSHVPYSSNNIALRNQGYCGNCWAWAATGVIEVEHSVQDGVTNQLSVQYLNSRYNGGTGSEYACCGGFADDFVTFYNGEGNDMFIPRSNSGGSYADGTRYCGASTARPSSQISTTTNYPFTSLNTQQITTTGVSRLTAINNIKNALNQNKAVWIAFYWHDNSADFDYAWDQGASYEYNPVSGVGSSGSLAGHAMTIIGYEDPNNDGSGYWIVLNSWGNRNNDPYLPGTIRFEMNMDYSALVPGYTSYNLPVSMYYIYNVTFTSATDPAPTVTSITPATGANTGTVSVTNLAGTNFKSGATIKLAKNGYTDITATNVVVSSSSKITCTFDLTSKASGTWDVVVIGPDGQRGTKSNAFTVTTNSGPTVTSITPSSGPNTGNLAATITGTNFRDGVTASLTRGTTTLTGTSLVRTGTSKIQCTFPTKDKPTGQYTLTIRNTDGLTVTKNAAFTLQQYGTYPSIASFTPISGQNTGNLPFTITGSNFRTGVSVTLKNNSMSKTIVSTRVTATRIKCNLPLTGMPIGVYNLTVKNTDGSAVTVTDAFTIISPTPVISSITPVSGYITGPVQATVTGKNFVNGAKVTLVNGATTIPYTITSFASTKIVGMFPLSGMPTGKYKLIVTNPGGQSATKTNAFTVLAPTKTPAITSFTPTSGPNAGNLPFTITGSNFRTGASVIITSGTTKKAVSSSKVTSTQIKCNLLLSGMMIGVYNLTVKNTDGTTVTIPNAFTVTSPTPVISSVALVPENNTGSVQATIVGKNFATGAEVTLVNGATTIPCTITTIASTKIIGTFPLSGMPAGKYKLTITNPGGPGATKTNAFTVLAPGTTPTITGISPSSGFNSADMKVAITGTLFNKPMVSITQGELTKIAPATAGRPSTDRIVYVTLPLKGVVGGLYNVTVRNSDGGSTTANDIFWVSDMFFVSSGHLASDNSIQNTGNGGITPGSSVSSSGMVGPDSDVV